MKDIKCPSCGKTFRIDPSSFEEILLQIKDEEFNKQIKERLILAEEDNKKALEILKRELKIKLIEQKLVFSIDYSSSFFFLILPYLFFLKNHLCKSLMGNHFLLDFRELLLFLYVSG